MGQELAGGPARNPASPRPQGNRARGGPRRPGRRFPVIPEEDASLTPDRPARGLKIAVQADAMGPLRRESCRMANWTATTTAKATPDQILEVLTHPDEIRRWSPVDFDVDELDASRLSAGTRARVTGKVAGVRVGFDVEVHTADAQLLELSADGPVGLDVRYELVPAGAGAELVASVALRRGGGLTGRLVANATA